jgi:lipopolysaccharide export system protein LptA
VNRFIANNKLISLAYPVGLLLFYLVFQFAFQPVWGQEGKSRKMIKIDSAKVLYVNNDVRRLIDNVKLSHENLILYCDSAWSYTETNAVDAFGKVHIISNDTLNLFANFIHYNGQSSLAKAFGKVKLKDPRLTLTTDTLDYDMKNDIGYYNCWGTVVDSSNTLTSRIGR